MGSEGAIVSEPEPSTPSKVFDGVFAEAIELGLIAPGEEPGTWGATSLGWYAVQTVLATVNERSMSGTPEEFAAVRVTAALAADLKRQMREKEQGDPR